MKGILFEILSQAKRLSQLGWPVRTFQKLRLLLNKFRSQIYRDQGTGFCVPFIVDDACSVRICNVVRFTQNLATKNFRHFVTSPILFAIPSHAATLRKEKVSIQR